MRLSEEEKEAIKGAVRQVFGEEAIVRLFGSWVDDRRKGGDIDLHLEVAKDKSSLAYELQLICVSAAERVARTLMMWRSCLRYAA